MAQPMIKEEVHKALVSIKYFNALGLDGFQPLFFLKYWDLLGDDFWKVVRDAFSLGKVDVTYKLIKKLIVNILRPFLNRFIRLIQNNFRSGRGTMDNAFLAQEIVHYMGTSSKNGIWAFEFF